MVLSRRVFPLRVVRIRSKLSLNHNNTTASGVRASFNCKNHISVASEIDLSSSSIKHPDFTRIVFRFADLYDMLLPLFV